jgi:hypothetical protein
MLDAQFSSRVTLNGDSLLTAETEYIALSQDLGETIPMTNLMQEMNVIFPLYLPQPKFVLKVREDNQSCIAISINAKFTPWTNHIRAPLGVRA